MSRGMASLLLDSRAAKTCPHRVHLDHLDPDAIVRVPPGEAERLRMEAGKAFENDVVDHLLEALGSRAVDLRESRDEEDTLDQMRRRLDLIVGGRLPADHAGRRKGIPDLLMHAGDGKYLPGDIKSHRTMDVRGPRAAPATTSPLHDPIAAGPHPDLKAALAKTYFGDLLQLAHYTRMLQALDLHPGTGARGAIIGTPVGDMDPMLTWFDLDTAIGLLDEPADKRDASVMELYDARHDLRARAAAGEADTFPVRTEACDSCHWLTRCRIDAGPHNPSFALRQNSMKARDWIALDILGVRTTRDMAGIDLDDKRFMGRFKKNCSTPSRGKKLNELALRADLIASGETIRRLSSGPLAVPRADIEVDIDFEWDTEGHTYLLGGLVRQGMSGAGGGSYRHFSSFEPIDAAGSRELVEGFVSWLRYLVSSTTERGETVAIFHYTPQEPARLKRTLGEEAVSDLLHHFIDLHAWVKEHFIGAHGQGIKEIAPALGFQWRDADPGGAQSQVWLQQARQTDDPLVRAELTRRLLSYNEDDVLAQAAIRDAARSRWGT